MLDKLKKRKYSRSRDIEPHEIILDKLAKQKEEEWCVSLKRVKVLLLERTLNADLFVLFLKLVFKRYVGQA